MKKGWQDKESSGLHTSWHHLGNRQPVQFTRDTQPPSRHGSCSANTSSTSPKGRWRGAIPALGATAPRAPGCSHSPGKDLSFCRGPAGHLSLPSLWFVLCFKEESWSFSLPDRCTHSIECTLKPNRTQPQAPPCKSLQLPPDNVIRWSRHSVPWINRAGWGSELLTFPDLKRPPEPQLLSRSDWLPPRMLMGKGRVMMLSLRWVRGRGDRQREGKTYF